MSSRSAETPLGGGSTPVLALLAFPLFFLANYAFNHVSHAATSMPLGDGTAFWLVFLPFGIVLPSVALGGLVRQAGAEPRRLGATLTLRDLAMAAIAFALGLLSALPLLLSKGLLQPAGRPRLAHLSVWLLMASLAEVLVFIGAVFHLVEGRLRGAWGEKRRGLATALAVIVSAACFGLFHSSYPAPWNSWGKAALLFTVWIGVATLFALTRSLLAAVVFDNMMTLVGFVVNDLSLPGTASFGLLLDAIAVAAAVILIAVTRRRVPAATT